MLNKSDLAKELAKREAAKRVSLLDPSFTLQTDFIQHPNKLKALFATRRFGKSYTGGLYLLQEALDNPGVSVLYIGLTRESAKRIMFKDVLKVINRKHKLGIKFNETTLTCTLPNGSLVYLMGVDSNEEEKDKLLGQKYKLAIVDECASYTINLRELVYGTLKPAMADLGGTIALLGTPGNLTKSLFFDVTTGAEPGWHLVKANTAENPYMAKRWAQEIADLKANQPYIVDTPMYKQMYEGQWVIDEDSLVYKFDSQKNLYKELPHFFRGEWQHFLGVDLGYEDATAFVVCAWHEYEKCLYIVDTYSRSKMDITDVAEKIKELRTRYNAYKVIIDGANKQAVEEIQRRHSIPLQAADKRGKEDFIEIMNAELIMGRIKAHDTRGTPLVQEWQNLVWKVKNGKLKLPKEENPACDNHLADACLYAWRYCYQYLAAPPVKPPAPGTPEWYEKEVREMEEAALAHFTALEEMTKNH